MTSVTRWRDESSWMPRPFFARQLSEAGFGDAVSSFSAEAEYAFTRDPWVYCTAFCPCSERDAYRLGKRISSGNDTITNILDVNAFALELGVDFAVTMDPAIHTKAVSGLSMIQTITLYNWEAPQMSDTGFDGQGITAGTELILSLPAPLRPASLFTPTPKAARRVLEFFTAQIKNPHTRRRRGTVPCRPARSRPDRGHGLHLRPRQRRAEDESPRLLRAGPPRLGAAARERGQGA